ncbi:Signal transduction histidine kinase, partial [human gut metagenome]
MQGNGVHVPLHQNQIAHFAFLGVIQGKQVLSLVENQGFRGIYRRELEKAKRRAEDLLAAREKLMLTITHDIKAPVGSILGYTDLLERITTEERQRFYLNNMQSSANHLLSLVKSLLDYHRLDAHKMDVNQVSFNPHQLFDTIYISFKPMADSKQLELNYHCNES